MKCGPINHTRWLTTANRTVKLWTSENGLEGEDLENLEMVVEWLVGCYYPMWFKIKINHHWLNGPYHVLHQLSLLRQQREVVQHFTVEAIQRGSWFAHSEMVLQSLLCSEEEGDKRFAVNKIIEIRKQETGKIQQEGELKKRITGKRGKKPSDLIKTIRARKTPEVNLEATSLINLISWDNDVHEPVLTMNLTEEELRQFYRVPMDDIPDFSLHTQSIERCVKQVTRAAATVFGYQKRDGFVRASAYHRWVYSCYNHQFTCTWFIIQLLFQGKVASVQHKEAF